jgi:hypothetical protein
MTSPLVRGPSGIAPPPPDCLAKTPLPITTIPAGQQLYRIHRSQHAPIFYGPGAGSGPVYRFDSASGRFGVLYVGHTFAGAFTETVLRNPQRLMVAESEINSRSVTELTSPVPLRMVTMHGAGLQNLGTDNSISTGPYAPCGEWADALWDHSDEPDGIAYPSRHDTSEIGITNCGDLDMKAKRPASFAFIQYISCPARARRPVRHKSCPRSGRAARRRLMKDCRIS